MTPRPTSRVCSRPGCPNLATTGGSCPIHNKDRGRGSTRAWRTARAQVLARDHRICHICGLPEADSVDHLTAKALGGTDNPSNLAAAHLSCNSARGARSRFAARRRGGGGAVENRGVADTARPPPRSVCGSGRSEGLDPSQRPGGQS